MKGYEIEKRFLIADEDGIYSNMYKDYIDLSKLTTQVMQMGNIYFQWYISPKKLKKGFLTHLQNQRGKDNPICKYIKSIRFPVDTLRLRKVSLSPLSIHTSYYITLKGKGSIKKREKNITIDKSLYDSLYSKFYPNLAVCKKRCKIPFPSKSLIEEDIWVEVDVFIDRFLIIMEVEVDKESELKNIPNLGLDITEDNTWSNKNLVKYNK